MQRFSIVVCFCCVLASVAPAGDVASPRDLTAAERQAVTDLAEKALKEKGLWKGKILLTTVEVVPDASAKKPQRFALLTYYRYEGDLGIVVSINVESKSVATIRSDVDVPTSLTPEEIAQAEKMARADARVQKALAKYPQLDKIEVDAMPARTVNPEAPGYRHRVARLFFRDAQRNYLQFVPMVDVDLTTGEVRLDAISGLHDKK